ncbi:hypothetical protein H7992_13575 [Sporosarcina sp. resist]|uniref:hypothetical protein n=1 Tax=Sporosarcina TaxID=1569 RepID=UPI00078D2EE4|nr:MULTISPECIES: hypothetical protein [Sporosarcina]AMQ06749.1 hypothetical protein AZE41_12845 [Sporosarcina psychrophila]QNK86297.1 hypothetical protein H7992_13575 [Sporosarcina sp. resist]
MVINQERLDEIKAELAERHQMPIEEVSRMIDGVIVGVTGMSEWLKPFVEGLSQLGNSMKEIILENHEKALWNTENEAMHGWDLDWDTSKRSQVLSNKPKFMVRKIIR